MTEDKRRDRLDSAAKLARLTNRRESVIAKLHHRYQNVFQGSKRQLP
jgi:hypothetical protein